MTAAILMFASGACALVWQMAWTASFGIALGHELVAVLAVLAAFFGGLALGSFALAGRIERSPVPGRWFAALEAVIALWGCAVVWLAPQVTPVLAQWLGPTPPPALHAAIAWSVPFLALLPSTLAMGATLPALERQVRADGGAVPLLYAANTAGAMAGVLAAVFVALPEWGVGATALATAVLQLAGAGVVLFACASRVSVPSLEHGPQSVGTRSKLRLFATGLLGIGFESLAVRVLAQVSENTVYTYAMLLAVFLGGTAAGAAAWRARRARARADGDRLLLALAFAVVLGGVALWCAAWLQGLPEAWFGASLATGLAGEALAAVAAMLPASVVMGALFSQQCEQALDEGLALGRAVGWNTLGCALAPLLVGSLLIPAFGARLVLALLAAGYLALLSARAWQHVGAGLAAACVAALAAFGPPLRHVDVPPGGRLLAWHEGSLAAVSVVADAQGVARLHIDNRVQEGSSAGGLVETRLAQLPLLLHGHARHALFLGLGTGYTAHAAAVDPRVDVRAVELLPGVIRASDLFMLRSGAPRAAHPVDVVAADARRYVQGDAAGYDVVVADLFHPGRSGAASLYTVEHFRAVRERLAPDGLFCQWLALHQMDLPTLRSIVAAFLQVYPDAMAVLAGNSLDTPVIGLVARPGRPQWTLQEVQAAFGTPSPALAGQLKLARLDDAFAVLGSVVADAGSLQRFAGDAAPNTDDLPVVARGAARVTYEPEARPRERLQALLHALAGPPSGAIAPGDQQAAALAAYWRARDRYLLLGLQWEADADPRQLLARAGPPLLQLLRESPHFTPAADSLAGLAQAVQGTDYPLAQQVMADLREARATVQPTLPSEPSVSRP